MDTLLLVRKIRRRDEDDKYTWILRERRCF